MKEGRLLVLGCSVLMACVGEGETLSTQTSAIAQRPGRFLVVFKAETAPADAGTRIKNAGGKPKRVLSSIGVASFEGTQAAAAQLASDPAVLRVGVEHIYAAPTPEVAKNRRRPPSGQPTPDDFLYGYQWDMRRIGAPAVWSRPQPARQPRIAVLDTGVMTTHPDLAGQICGEKAFTYCATQTSWPSVAYPAYDTLIDFDAFPMWEPANGCSPAPLVFHSHGTHVAGTVAAKRGGGAVVGVAPNACVGAYKVFDRYRFTDPDGGVIEDLGAFDAPLFAAIIDAADSGYPVISMSLGGVLDLSLPEHQAAFEAWKRVTNYANKKGAVVVAAAGNDALDLSGSLANVPSDLPHVLSVAATGATLAAGGTPEAPVFDAVTNADVLAFYSNFGDPIDISAPGGDCGPAFDPTDPTSVCALEHLILSSYISEVDQIDINGNVFPAGEPGWAWFAGTSMATPHVAAVAAQVRAKHPAWTPQRVRQHLEDTAENIGPQLTFGAGMLRADRAVH